MAPLTNSSRNCNKRIRNLNPNGSSKKRLTMQSPKSQRMCFNLEHEPSGQEAFLALTNDDSRFPGTLAEEADEEVSSETVGSESDEEEQPEQCPPDSKTDSKTDSSPASSSAKPESNGSESSRQARTGIVLNQSQDLWCLQHNQKVQGKGIKRQELIPQPRGGAQAFFAGLVCFYFGVLTWLLEAKRIQ